MALREKMLRKKKKSNKHELPVVEVNVVSLMDILTTLLFFLLLVASFTKYSVVDATALPPSDSSETDKKPTFTLEIAFTDGKSASIWLGPVQKLKMVDSNQLISYMNGRFTGNAEKGYFKKITAKNSSQLVQRIQEVLIRIKKSFPHELKAVATFKDQVDYQELIDFVSGIRSLPNSHSGYRYEDLIGKKGLSRVLFPQVIMAEYQAGV